MGGCRLSRGWRVRLPGGAVGEPSSWCGRWMGMRWRICAGIWRITCGRRSGCMRTGARRWQARLAGWGEAVFAAVFGSGPARDAYQRMRARTAGLELVFRSASPGLLGLPWELMR